MRDIFKYFCSLFFVLVIIIIGNNYYINYENNKIDWDNITIDNEIKEYQNYIASNSTKFNKSFYSDYYKKIVTKKKYYNSIQGKVPNEKYKNELDKIKGFLQIFDYFETQKNYDEKANFILLQELVSDYGIKHNLKMNKIERKIEGKQIKLAFLTFDDGPSKNTSLIIDKLNKNNVNGTFFFIGKEIEKNKKIMDELLKEYKNHSFGIHGYSHDYKKSVEYKTFSKEQKRTQEQFHKSGFRNTLILRSPYGSTIHSNKNLNKYKKNGYYIWDWNIDSLDWENKNKSNKVAKNIKKQFKNLKDEKYITILYHEYPSTINTLESTIKLLSDNNYVFARIPEQHYKSNDFFNPLND